MAIRTKPNEIGVSRVYDAPVKSVWEAWTDPEQTAKWWGPRGFTLTNHSMDIKPGGTWVYTSHGPDGVDYPNYALYHEVEKHSRLVYDHGTSENQPPLFRIRVTFAERSGKTSMEMTMTLPTPEATEETMKFIKKAGGDSTWDRLAEYLEKEMSGKEVFVINRSFNAPLETLFDVWTTPEHMAKWTPPAGFRMEFKNVEVRPGGGSFYLMTNDAGVTMYGRTHYLEISRPNRIVYTQQFADEKGQVARHPMSPTWPETMLTTITFTSEGPDRTRATIKWEPSDQASQEEIETFAAARAGMDQGWSGSFEKLEEYLQDL